MSQFYDLNIQGSEVQLRLDLASHNVLAFDGILDVPVVASDALITEAGTYQIVYAPNGGRGEMLLSMGGVYYRHFKLQSEGKTVLDSSWYNTDGQIRRDRLFLNGAARDIYAYAAGAFGKVERDGVDGITPHIDTATRHWMIGEADTGILARGTDGKSAYELWVELPENEGKSIDAFWAYLTADKGYTKQVLTYAEFSALSPQTADTDTIYVYPNADNTEYYNVISNGTSWVNLITKDGEIADFAEIKAALTRTSSSYSIRYAILERGAINGATNSNIAYNVETPNTIRLRASEKFQITGNHVKVVAHSRSGLYVPSVTAYNGCDSNGEKAYLTGSNYYTLGSEVNNAIVGNYVRFIVRIKDTNDADVTEITDDILNDIYVSNADSDGILFDSSNSTSSEGSENTYYNVGEIADKVERNSRVTEKLEPLTEGKTVGSEILTIDNYGINYNTGEVQEYTLWKASDYIYVKAGTTLKIKGSPGNNFGLAFYESKNESSYISGTRDYNKNEYSDIEVPEDANYFRVCGYADIDKFSIQYVEFELETLPDVISGMNTALDNLKVVNGGTTAIEYHKEILIIENYGTLFADGKLFSYGGWTSTDFIKIQAGTNRKIKLKSTAGNNFGTAFYTSDNESSFISGTKYYDGENTYNTNAYYDIDVPDDANYMRTCCMAASNYADKFGLILPFNIKSYFGVAVQTEDNTDNITRNREDITALKKSLSSSALSAGKTYISKNKKIMLSGASLAYNANGWFENACSWLGVNGINKAISGTRIGQFAKRLYDNDYVTQSELEDTEILILNHVHNKDVYSLPEAYKEYSVEDYEAEAQTNFLSNGGDTSDETYAKAFDYVIKKWIKMNMELKDNPDSSYYQTTFGHQAKILLCTYWHDGRTKYNESVRKLSGKWGFPLIKFDENIGMSCKVKSGNFITDSDVVVSDLMRFAMASAEGMGSNQNLCVIGGVQYNAELINGIIVPWHYVRGANQEIQKRLAAILKNMIEAVGEINNN